MIIECPHCESKVDGVVQGEYVYQPEQYDDPVKFLLLKCPVCEEALVGRQDCYETGPDTWEWSVPATRLWPDSDRAVSWNVPGIVRDSLTEARKCFRASAYSACAVMCGRALEGVCSQYSTKRAMLAGGLQELLDKKIIDERLFRWGDELREHRNIGAHASEEQITKEDALDLLDFANAICEYIFVLDAKFQKFMQRKQQKANQ